MEEKDGRKINCVSGVRSSGFELEPFWLPQGMAGDLSFLLELPYFLLGSGVQCLTWMFNVLILDSLTLDKQGKASHLDSLTKM